MTDLPDRVREARPDDVPAITALVHDLGAHQEAPSGRVRLTEAGLHDALFGPDPAASALVGTDAADRVVAIAVWYRIFSTWDGVPGIHLEDLYVGPDQRGSGLARALVTGRARIARDRGYGRVAWEVLRWNEGAIAAYTALGAEPLDDGFEFRLDRAALERLADA